MDARQAQLLKEIDPRTLGARIRHARLSRALTQGELAESVASTAYISRIEAGQRRPDGKLLKGLANRLDTTLDQLLLGLSTDELTELRLGLDFAELALESGEAPEAERRAAEAIRGLEAVDSDLIHRAHFVHARALEVLGQLDDAILELEDLLEDGTPDPAWIATAIALSRCYRQSGDFGRAIEVGERAIAQLTEAGLDGVDEAVQLAVTVASAHFGRGDVAHAVRLCKRAITKAESLGSPVARASAYWNASAYETEQGRHRTALALADKALALFGEGRDARNLARLRSLTGILHLRQDPPEITEARRILTRAGRDLAASSASHVDLARNDLALARTYFFDGSLDKADDLAQRALATTRESAPVIAADAQTLLGQIAAQNGHPEGARSAYLEGVLILTGIGADRAAAECWFELATLLDEIGEHDQARQAYRSAAASTGLTARVQAPVRA